MTAPAKVLLTGASGVLGRAVLDRSDSGRTTCLFHRNVAPTSGEWLAGSITEKNFGLSSSEYAELARKVDVIVHCAAITDYSAPEREMNAVNVEGVKHVLEFAARAEAHLYHVSTAFVLRRIEEHDIWRTPAARWWDPAVYLESKRASDRLVADSGLPAAILRPSLTFGDSASGATVRFQGVHTVMRAFFSNNLPMIPALPQARIDYVPTNVVAELVAGLTDLRLTGELWLTAGEEALTASEMMRIGTDYLTAKGIAVAPPRMVAPDMMERLIIPVFLPELPRRLRRRYEQLLVLAPLFFHEEPYPSDLRTLGRALGTSIDLELISSLSNALEYWRATNRRTEAHV
jgi:nucleoside-diphosphate-sugar epimerase